MDVDSSLEFIPQEKKRYLGLSKESAQLGSQLDERKMLSEETIYL